MVKKEVMLIYLGLFLRLVSSLKLGENTEYHGLISDQVPWGCGSGACAILFLLAGESVEPRLKTAHGCGIFLKDVADYLQDRGWEVEGCKVTWEQLRSFFELSPNRPLLAHCARGFGHYVLLLGLVHDFLVVGDPVSGVCIVPPPKFLEHFSGYVYHFPELSPLSTIERILAALNERLFLRSNRVAEERKGRLGEPTFGSDIVWKTTS